MSMASTGGSVTLTQASVNASRASSRAIRAQPWVILLLRLESRTSSAEALAINSTIVVVVLLSALLGEASMLYEKRKIELKGMALLECRLDP